MKSQKYSKKSSTKKSKRRSANFPKTNQKRALNHLLRAKSDLKGGSNFLGALFLLLRPKKLLPG